MTCVIRSAIKLIQGGIFDMQKAYFETLPKNYFGGFYEKVTSALIKGENVCVSVIPGFGEKTVFNFLNYNFLEDELFNRIFIYDPELESVTLTDFAKQIDANNSVDNNLLIVRFFERIENKPEVLEKLDSIRRKNPKKLVYLVISNQEAILYPQTHQALSTVFFSSLIHFGISDTFDIKKMIDSLVDYYGWRIDPKLFKDIEKLSGEIPRIIKYLVKESYESRIPLSDKNRLISIPQISFQLNFLTKILLTHDPRQINLLGLTDDKNKLKSELLKYYLKNFRSEMIAKLYPNLGDTECRILSFFSANQGEIVSLDKLANLMKMSDEDFSLLQKSRYILDSCKGS